MPTSFEQLLRNVPHEQPRVGKYRKFNQYLGELLGLPGTAIYTAYISKSGNWDVRLTQSVDARKAWLRVALVPKDRDWRGLKDLASRTARERYPGTAVLVISDKPEGWTPVWGIEPAEHGQVSDRPSHLSLFATSFVDFELQTYVHMSREEGLSANLTEQAAQILEELATRPQITQMLYRMDRGLFARLIEDDVAASDVVAIAHRRAVVERFRRLLREPQFFAKEAERIGGEKEKVWQDLLEKSPWILGVSLAGQLLTSWDNEKLERAVAGFSISGPGKRADAVMHTSGRIRAMVFAEIKHHETELLGGEYRPGCWEPSKELSAGVVQAQQTVHIATRQMYGSLSETDESGAETGERTYLVRPRSFLILGNLEQLRGAGGVHRAKYESFELYRRNLYEPEVITFDELLARAEWHVEVLDEEQES